VIRRLLAPLLRRRWCPLCRRWQTDLATHQPHRHGNELAQHQALGHRGYADEATSTMRRLRERRKA